MPHDYHDLTELTREQEKTNKQIEMHVGMMMVSSKDDLTDFWFWIKIEFPMSLYLSH